MKVNVWKRCEIVLNSAKEYSNPFADVDIDAVFTHADGTQIALPGFWNGGNEWKVRFSPDRAGIWKYTVTCTDKENASLCATGEIEAVAAEPSTELERHGFVKLTKGLKHFTYADGTPFFYLGDTHWQMPDLERLDVCNYPGCTCGNQFKHVVDDRIKKGFNVYQTYFDSAESDGGGNPRIRHWWQEKFTLINPQAFNESMDIMMEYLADNGITIALGFGVHCSTTTGFKFQAEPLLKFTRYCVARYACYPVIWITGQEITNLTKNTFEIWDKVGALVDKIDGYHRPLGAHQHAHPAESDQSVNLDKLPWHQWWTLQAGHRSNAGVIARQFYKGYHDLPSNKMYIETECSYEDLGLSVGGTCGEGTRRGAWNAVQSGSAGFTYGVEGIWALRWDEQPRGWTGYSPEPWYVGLDKPGSTEMTYLKDFYNYVGWDKLEPSFGFDLGMFECRRTVTISHNGNDIVIYYFSDDDIETGMANKLKRNVKYQARWFDPVNGYFINLPSFVTDDGEYEMPLRPSKRDWVLLLNCVDLGDYKSVDSYPKYLRTLAPQDVSHGDEIAIAGIRANVSAEGHPAENMIDGNPDTYWCANAALQSKTIYIDLGESQEVGWIQIMSCSKDALFINYRVYGSNDGVNYDIISERCHHRSIGVGGQYKDFYDYLDGKYRYIKLAVMPADYGTANLEIAKLGIYKK